MRRCTRTLNRPVASALVVLAADAKARHVSFSLVFGFEEGLVLGASVERLVVVGNIGNVATLDIGQFLLARSNFIKRHDFEGASPRVEHSIIVGVKIVSPGQGPRLSSAIIIHGLE